MTKNKAGENRLAQSEKVTSTSKSSTYYNYLNNRMSVRIKYGGRDGSLAKRLLGSGKSPVLETDTQYDFGDLENPLLGDNTPQ